MFAADISDDHGHIDKQIVFDSGTILDLIEKYLLDKDMINPLQYVCKIYEVK